MALQWYTIFWICNLGHMFTNVLSIEADQPNYHYQFDDCLSAFGCDCADLDHLVGVYCDNLTDFETFKRRLTDGVLFNDPLVTFEIVLTGTKRLPSKSFDGLIVFRLIIEDPITDEIAPDAFVGAKSLKRLHVRTSSLKTIPNVKVVSHKIWNLNLDDSLLISLDSEVQDLPLLHELSLRNNSIIKVAEDAFRNSINITTLDLSINLLEVLPTKVFDHLPALRKLALSQNRIVTVHGLFSVVRPRFILLDHNNLTNADDILHDNMTVLETLQLDHNPLRKISENTFRDKARKMRFLYLMNCEIQEFDVKHYKNLDSLAILDLSDNIISNIPNQKITFGKNLQLFLNNNSLSSFNAELTFIVKRIYLQHNNFRVIGSFLQYSQLSDIVFEDNFIEAITEPDLKNVHDTDNILFRNNNISRLDTMAFFSVRNDLQNLDLSCNQLQALNGSMRYLSRLKSLNVSNNFIEHLQSGEFIGLNELSELYMQSNKIIVLGEQLLLMDQLQYLIITANMLTTVNTQQFPKSMRFLHYGSNPIVCDCKLLPFLMWLNQSSTLLQTDVLYCRPDDTISQNVERYHYVYCPSLCSCKCEHNGDDYYIEVDCSARNISTAPVLFQKNVNSTLGKSLAAVTDTLTLRFFEPTVVWQTEERGHSIADRILSVNLENNTISSVVNWSFPVDLTQLRLANNKLTELPTNIQGLSSLNKVTLSSNPWSCDCGTTAFKKWLLYKNDAVLDVNKTQCGPNEGRNDLVGKLIVNLSDIDLCPQNVSLIISITFSVLCVMLLLMGTRITYTKYELFIKIWLYDHGFPCVKEYDIDRDKEFDAFFSYSYKDEMCVMQIRDEISRREPKIRICLHRENFLAGETIFKNIINAVASSRRTVLFVSRNFVNSMWCQEEFRNAHLQSLKDKRNRILIIKVGEIPADEIHEELQRYMEYRTYLILESKHFWKQLLFSLPSPSKDPINTEKITALEESA